MSSVLSPKAITTSDGCITHISDMSENHPVYGTEAFAIRVVFDLTSAQVQLLTELLDRSDLKEVHRSTRSSLDQLGILGAQKDTTHIKVNQTCVEMETLMTGVGENVDMVLKALRNVYKQGCAKYCRLLLAPEESKRGERALPILTDDEIYYDTSRLSKETLVDIWLGAPGREAIFSVKEKRPLPIEIQPGQFFITEMNGMSEHCSSKEHLWILKRRIRQGSWSNKTTIRHGDACGFDPHRSIGRR